MSIEHRVANRFKTASADPLTPEEAVAGIEKCVRRSDARLKSAPRVVPHPRIPGMFSVTCDVQSDGVITHISVTFDPQKGAWFQVASIWDNGRREKNLDERVARSAQYKLLFDVLLVHLTENKPGPWA